MSETDALTYAHELTLAWLANPDTRTNADEVSTFMKTMVEAVGALAAPPLSSSISSSAEQHTPAVSVRKSLADPNRMISLIDGKPYASLTRHLRAHGLTPDEYRTRYNLKSDYPMVAPGFKAARSAAAKKLGLGRKPGPKVATKPKEGTPGKRGTKSISEAKKAAQAHLGTNGS